jgi:SAM-dependent methyltransferase
MAIAGEVPMEEKDSAEPLKHFRDKAFWENRATSFAGYAVQTRYAEGLLKLMDLKPEWTVFDMACGGGTLTVPLAAKVKSVTAVDFSQNMLSILDRRCKEGGITNVKMILGRWEDDWSDLGIAAHDIAIASRSIHEENASRYIQKLTEIAKRQVWISAPVGHGPWDARLYEFAGRSCVMGADYMHYYNILHQSGIRANVAFVEENHRSSWGTPEEAFEDQRWMFHGMTTNEAERVKEYLNRHLIHQSGQWQLPYERKCYWAVMWWAKE